MFDRISVSDRTKLASGKTIEFPRFKLKSALNLNRSTVFCFDDGVNEIGFMLTNYPHQFSELIVTRYFKNKDKNTLLKENEDIAYELASGANVVLFIQRFKEGKAITAQATTKVHTIENFDSFYNETLEKLMRDEFDA